uniref:Uncharacterized protein n=1 Tax=Anguilla anguilla TaxID=7936 RepID=A0A0E9TU91_ANGAN
MEYSCCCRYICFLVKLYVKPFYFFLPRSRDPVYL